MRNVLWVLSIVLLCTAWIAGTAYFGGNDKPSGRDKSKKPDYSATFGVKKPAAEVGPFPKNSSAANQPLPRAVVDVDKHDFGLMNPVTEGVHVFTVTNQGQAPLKLRQGPTTCKCTLSKLSGEEVLPGQSAEVRLEWNTGATIGLFQHSSTVWTNDPLSEALELEVVGVVCRRLGVDPPDAHFESLHQGERRTMAVTLYSHAWSDFEIVNVKHSLPGLEYAVEPASPEDLEKLKAASGYRLALTVPGNLPAGPFAENVTVVARSKNGCEPELELPLYVSGHVLSRISVVGPAMEDGRVNLGTLPRDKGGRTTLSMIVRGLEAELNVLDVKTSPDFLEVRVEPPRESEKSSARLRVYRIHVSVPAGAPLGHYLGADAGEFVIKVNHSKVVEVRMNVDFAVEERP